MCVQVYVGENFQPTHFNIFPKATRDVFIIKFKINQQVNRNKTRNRMNQLDNHNLNGRCF